MGTHSTAVVSRAGERTCLLEGDGSGCKGGGDLSCDLGGGVIRRDVGCLAFFLCPLQMLLWRPKVAKVNLHSAQVDFNQINVHLYLQFIAHGVVICSPCWHAGRICAVPSGKGKYDISILAALPSMGHNLAGGAEREEEWDRESHQNPRHITLRVLGLLWQCCSAALSWLLC